MEVTELPRLHPSPLEEVVDRLSPDADSAPPTGASVPRWDDVSRQLATVDECMKRVQLEAKQLGRLRTAQPVFIGGRRHGDGS